MNNLIVPFRSRKQAMTLSRALNERGYASELINTPRVLTGSCGLSVKTVAPFDLVLNLCRSIPLTTLLGVYNLSGDNYLRLYP